jgi:hypothetical protein
MNAGDREPAADAVLADAESAVTGRRRALVGRLPGLGDLAARAMPRGLRRRPGGLEGGGAGAELVEFGPVGVDLLLGSLGAATQVSAKLGRCRVQVLGSVLWFLAWRLGRR